MQTESLAAAYERDGYLRYGKLLEVDEVAALRAGLDRVARLELTAPDDSSPEFAFGHRRQGVDWDASPRAITQFVNMWKRDEAYAEIIRKPLIVEVAKELLGASGVRLWHDQVIAKPPGDNGHFRFHQDFYFWPLDSPTIVSCWLALDEATVDNGCMHVIPGSHRDERFTPEARAKALPDGDPARREMEAQPASVGKPVELAAGEGMFHHCLNFHATPQNETDRQRRAFVIIMMAEGVRYHPEQSPNHILVPIIEVAPGEPMGGANFPFLG